MTVDRNAGSVEGNGDSVAFPRVIVACNHHSVEVNGGVVDLNGDAEEGNQSTVAAVRITVTAKLTTS